MESPGSDCVRRPWIEGDKSYSDVTRDVFEVIEGRPGPAWWVGLLVAFAMLCTGAIIVTHQIWTGIGTWGLNKTVGWAWDITNFVFWVGIGHAGTLISAILFLLRQRWRTSVNRAAEAMTIFAVCCAGIFPLIHMGRPWLAFWMAPYPNFRGPLWLNFRSPLLWDVFAISTYLTVSATFWFVGLIPDLATARDRSAPGSWRRQIFEVLAMGWDGSARGWTRYEKLYLLLAGLSTPLVFSVHTVVSFDFATSVIPGWHATLFPPYFVCGAIFSGFAMVLTLMLIARRVMGFEQYITARHIDVMCKVTLLTSCIVGLAYGTELFIAWYSQNRYEQFAFANRMWGPYSRAYMVMVLCNVVIPQLLWSPRVRATPLAVFFICIGVNIGMWLERFVIIVLSLHRDYLPSSWMDYSPTWVEIGTFAGSFGLFFTCFFLFCRFLPMIAVAEVKSILKHGRTRAGVEHAH